MDAMTWLRAQWDRVAGFGLIGLGALAMLLGFRGVSNTGFVSDQLTYIISGGLGGLFLLGCGAVLLLVAEMRDEWRKLDGIEALLRAELVAEPESRSGSGGPTVADGATAPARRARGPRLEAAAPTSPSLMTATGVLPTAVTPLTVVALGGTIVAMAAAHASVDGQSDVDLALRSTGWAVAALIVAAVIVGGSTLSAQRRVRLRQTELFAPFLLRGALRATEPRYLTAHARRVGEAVVMVPGLTRYHRSGCPAVAGLDVVDLTISEAARTAVPCGLCC